MKNKFTKIFVSLMAMFIVLIAADTGNAQMRRIRGVSKQQVENLLERIEERTDRFSNQLNKSLDRSRLDGGRTEDNIADRARDLENASDELRREFDFNDTRGETRTNARKVLNTATLVNRIMIRRNFSRQAETSWVNLRAEINALARIYRLPTVGARSYR
jgi:hypothetical protein